MKIRIIAHAGRHLGAALPVYTSGPARDTVDDAVTAFRDMCVERFGDTWFAVGAWISSGPVSKPTDYPERYQEICAALHVVRNTRILSVWAGGESEIYCEQPHPSPVLPAFSSLAP